MVQKSVHTSILCAPPLPCHRATFRILPHKLIAKGVIPTTPEEMERFLQERQSSGEDALMDELKRMTKEQEQAGEMSPTRMEEIYQTLSPFLTDRQREKMREVIRRLKS